MKNIISLGHDCQIAAELKRNGHEVNNAISDMSSMTIGGVNHLLRSRFVDFFARDKLCILGNMTIASGKKVIGFNDSFNRLYSSIPINKIPVDKSIYECIDFWLVEKRSQIEELYGLLNNEPYVQILRSNINQEKLEEIVELRDTVAKIRNGLDFDLYVFQDSKFMNNIWGVPNLHTFEMQHWIWNDKWIGESDIWKKVFLMLMERRNIKIFS